MNNFRFGKISIVNFMSIGEIPCEIDLSAVNSTLIVGMNGSGKTTILEALTFVLFNKTYRKIRKGNIVNSYTNKDCSVNLTLTIGKDEYDITRSIKPDSFEVLINGKPMDVLAGSVNQQEQFENILGLDFNVYKQLIVLGTSGYEEFMSLTTGDRRKLLESILKLDILSDMDKDNKGIVKNLNIKLDQCDIKLGGLVKQKEQSEESMKRWKSLYDAKLKEIKELKANKSIFEIERDESEKNYLDFKSEIGDAPSIKKPELESNVVMTKDDSDKFNKIYKLVDDKRASGREKVLDIYNLISNETDSIVSLEQDIKLLKRDISVFETVISRYKDGGKCPSCYQELSEHDNELKNINEIIVSKNNEIEILEGRKDIHAEKIVSFNKSVDDINVSLESLDEYVKKADKMKEKVEKEVALRNNEINQRNRDLELSYQSVIHDYELKLKELNNLKSVWDNNCKRVDECDNMLSRLNEDINNNYNTSDNTSKEIDEEIDGINKDKENILLDIFHRSIITDLLKDSGIRSDMINRYIPLFNQSVQKYLNLLGADYIFTVDSNFNESIFSRGREDFKYESFSRGEQARIDLAILFSWRDIISNVSGQEITALFLDEVFDSSTDSQGVDGIKRVLDSLENVNIFSISHKDHDPEDFDSVINVNKVGRFSTYERTFNNKHSEV